MKYIGKEKIYRSIKGNATFLFVDTIGGLWNSNPRKVRSEKLHSDQKLSTQIDRVGGF